MIDVLTMNTRIRIVPQLWSATHILDTLKKTESTIGEARKEEESN
jgi:hypothetical protein